MDSERIAVRDDVSAIYTLYVTLESRELTFSNKHGRNEIMSSLFEAIKFGKTEVKVAAIRCLTKIFHLFYQYMELDMLSDLLTITEAIKSGIDVVAVEAIRFWSEVSDVEIKLANTAATVGGTSKFFVKSASKQLVDALFDALIKQESTATGLLADECNPSKIASECLMSVAKCCKSDIVKHVDPFIEKHIHSTDWKLKEAAIFSVGAILDGPEPSDLEGPVKRFLSQMQQLLCDKNDVVRDTAAWSLCMVADFVPEYLTRKHTMPLLNIIEKHVGCQYSNVFWMAQADTYSPSKAASYCLTEMAKRDKNRITEDVLPFVKHNINGGKVEAGIIALGCILEGPDRSILEPVFREAMPHLLQAPRGSVGYDSAMWTICRACFYIPEAVIGQNSLPSLIGALIKGLNERPIVAANICRAFCCLSKAFYEKYVSMRDGEERNTMHQNSFGKYLPIIVKNLLSTAKRSDACNNQFNLKTEICNTVRDIIQYIPTGHLLIIDELDDSQMGLLNITPMREKDACKIRVNNFQTLNEYLTTQGVKHSSTSRTGNEFRIVKTHCQDIFEDCEATRDLCIDRPLKCPDYPAPFRDIQTSSLAFERPVRDDDLDFCLSTVCRRADKSSAYTAIPYKMYRYTSNEPEFDSSFEKCIRDLRLSERGILLMPVNPDTAGPGTHWLLVIANRFSKRVYLMDSDFLKQVHRIDESRYEERLLEYKDIYVNVFRFIEFVDRIDNVQFSECDWSCCYVVDTVQQPNDFDCGVYTIMNANAVVTRTNYTNSENWRQKLQDTLSSLLQTG